jgi:hypothetical protein
MTGAGFRAETSASLKKQAFRARSARRRRSAIGSLSSRSTSRSKRSKKGRRAGGVRHRIFHLRMQRASRHASLQRPLLQGHVPSATAQRRASST